MEGGVLERRRTKAIVPGKFHVRRPLWLDWRGARRGWLEVRSKVRELSQTM